MFRRDVSARGLRNMALHVVTGYSSHSSSYTHACPLGCSFVFCFPVDNTEKGARQPGALQSALRHACWETLALTTVLVPTPTLTRPSTHALTLTCAHTLPCFNSCTCLALFQLMHSPLPSPTAARPLDRGHVFHV